MRLVPHVAMSSTAGPEETLITIVVQQLHIQSTWTGWVAKDVPGGARRQRNDTVFWLFPASISYVELFFNSCSEKKPIISGGKIHYHYLTLKCFLILYLCLARTVWKRRTGSILQDLVTVWMKLSAQSHRAQKDSTCPQQGFHLDIKSITCTAITLYRVTLFCFVMYLMIYCHHEWCS